MRSETDVERYIGVLANLAAHLGRPLAELLPDRVAERFTDADASLFLHGLRRGLLRVDERAWLHTLDPRQDTAWLVEGHPARPCWEYLPHAAAYVELLTEYGFPASLVRFETPDGELDLNADLAVTDEDGRLLVVGEAKKTVRELDRLVRDLSRYASADPGKPRPDAGSAKPAWKLAHRLWATRAPWLWLVGPATRRAFRVSYAPLALIAAQRLPDANGLGLKGRGPSTPPYLRPFTSGASPHQSAGRAAPTPRP